MDNFQYHRDSVSDPARSARVAVPQDAAMLPIVPKAVFVGSGGDVKLRCIDDEAPVLFRNVPSGTILPLRAAELWQSDTTAGDLVLLS